MDVALATISNLEFLLVTVTGSCLYIAAFGLISCHEDSPKRPAEDHSHDEAQIGAGSMRKDVTDGTV